MNDPSLDFSTLVALARAGRVDDDYRSEVLNDLSTDWAKRMATAILDNDEQALQSPQERTDLKVVRRLAGVAP